MSAGLTYPTAGRWAQIAKYWLPEVMDRIIALWQAIAAEFDTDPYLEGVNTDSTATGSAKNSPDFNWPDNVVQLKRQYDAMTAAFDKTVVTVYVDYASGYEQELIDYARSIGAGTGAPDVQPDGKNSIDSYKSQMQGLMPLCQAVQTPELCSGSTGVFTPEQIYQYAMNTLHLTHMYWIAQSTACDTSTQKYSFQYGIIPTVNNHNGFTYSSCPANLPSCDVS